MYILVEICPAWTISSPCGNVSVFSFSAMSTMKPSGAPEKNGTLLIQLPHCFSATSPRSDGDISSSSSNHSSMLVLVCRYRK